MHSPFEAVQPVLLAHEIADEVLAGSAARSKRCTRAGVGVVISS